MFACQGGAVGYEVVEWNVYIRNRRSTPYPEERVIGGKVRVNFNQIRNLSIKRIRRLEKGCSLPDTWVHKGYQGKVFRK